MHYNLQKDDNPIKGYLAPQGENPNERDFSGRTVLDQKSHTFYRELDEVDDGDYHKLGEC